MDFLVDKVKDSIYAIAFWDTEWKSYNNCYFVLEEDGVIMIDSCKEEHSKYLLQALHHLGKTADDVKLVLATHGHEDHVEGAQMFKHAKKLIHPKEGEEIRGFDRELSDQGVAGEFDYMLAGYHSPGSVIYYHRPSRILFTGDLLCFFGDPLSKEGLVSEGKELRQAWVDYLKGGGVSTSDLPGFLEALKIPLHFQSEIMCTGHGGVLVGEVNGFIEELVSEARNQLNVETK
ncbi:MBL fold metallo-hydrolase [Rossellomorea oryzaecorticis]|jgi:glyoxylase-like metal-dependent hydrolase (beta-lactamase superfamily II)|uniref:MBL fold metallo-hydrolase n=1 Tax=Rossellomorea oryzaecorticis TaxID=1396505 RepID=A0ABW8VXC8_9BACI